jgi:hypothetical protein
MLICVTLLLMKEDDTCTEVRMVLMFVSVTYFFEVDGEVLLNPGHNNSFRSVAAGCGVNLQAS